MHDRRGFLRRMGAGAALAAFADTRSAVAERLESLSSAMRAGEPFERLAAEYMLSPDVLYLNHASIGTIPRVVHAARMRYLEICETNPHLYIWGGAWNEARESVRARAALMLHCLPEEVAVTHNTTEGFNILAQGLPLGEGDEVVFSSLNHGGASACWEHQAKVRGYTVRRFDFPILDTPSMTAADVVAAHVRAIGERTRVLVFPHIDNIVGLRHPVREITRAARARGVRWIAVDGAQSLGMIPVDVAADDVDFYAASPHKWLQAPKGLGLFYVRQSLQESLRPMWVTAGQVPPGTARVFEDYGTRNLPELLSLGDAIDYQLALGGNAKMERYRAMWSRFRDAVEASTVLRWYSPRDWELGASLFLIGFGESVSALSDRLQRSNGVVFRAFHTQGLEGGRISPNVQTTDAEIELFLGLLRA